MSSPPSDHPPVQLNVRIPASVKAAAQERAEFKGMKLGKWVENAIRYALDQHGGVTSTPAGRTAPPPHRRGVNL